jgi:hypothetical protein
MSDKGYSESTLEKQKEFARKRNYTYITDPKTRDDIRAEDEAFKDIENRMEWDNWKPIEDIV